MWIRYTLSALDVLAAKALTIVLAPIIALPPFITQAEESETTGYPSLHPGKPREFLIKPLRWLQTHDAPLDEYYYAGYYKGKWTERFKHNKWFMRMCWLWRNPAYDLSESLGLDQPMFAVSERTNNNWRKPVTSYEYWTATNSKGQWGLCSGGSSKFGALATWSTGLGMACTVTVLKNIKLCYTLGFLSLGSIHEKTAASK